MAHTCSDCREPLRLIRIIQQLVPVAAAELSLAYNDPSARASWITGRFPLEGTIRGWLCPRCGLVRLYAVGADEPAEVTPAEG